MATIALCMITANTESMHMFSLNLTPEKAEFLYDGVGAGFRAAGAAADLDDLGVEVDDDMDHLEREEAEHLARKLKPMAIQKLITANTKSMHMVQVQWG